MPKFLSPSFLLSHLSHAFSDLDLPALARSSGFIVRERKVKPLAFVKSVCLLSSLTSSSLSSWASLYALLQRRTLSKQALGNRCTDQAVAFLEQVLKRTLAKLWNDKPLPADCFASFPRVLVQDSTAIRLPDKLMDDFPGPGNMIKRSANLKIQSLYDLKNELFLKFQITPYTDNDQKASKLIFDVVRPGDLVLRDLGYSVLQDFKELNEKGCFFLSLLRKHVLLMDPASGKLIHLIGLLRKTGHCDIDILLGESQKIPLRLIARQLSPEHAAERRRKARANRDRRRNPSDEYMELLGWIIFITNVPRETLTPKEICKVYGFRWRIEIWFKAWKTHFNFSEVTAGSGAQMRLLFYGRLLWISLFQVILRKCRYLDENISLLKLARWTRDFILPHFFGAIHPEKNSSSRKMLAYYCKYEKRRKRKNFTQNLLTLS